MLRLLEERLSTEFQPEVNFHFDSQGNCLSLQGRRERLVEVKRDVLCSPSPIKSNEKLAVFLQVQVQVELSPYSSVVFSSISLENLGQCYSGSKIELSMMADFCGCTVMVGYSNTEQVRSEAEPSPGRRPVAYAIPSYRFSVLL
jgi:hypothetical protein